MRKSTQSALAQARVEKDVENAYREEIRHHRSKAEITSPHGTDGHATWANDSESLHTVRLLLETKFDQALKAKLPVCNVLGQLILYLKKFEQAGDVLPNVLFVGSKTECFVLATDAVRGFLNLDLDWSAAPSKGSPELTRALVSGFNLLPYVYDVHGDMDFKEVLEKVETLARGARHQSRATATNLEAIFVYWRDNVFTGKGPSALTPVEQVDVFLRCLFQPGDVYLHPTKRGVLVVPGYAEGVIVNGEQYRSFFDHFAQGYKPSEVEAFYGMKDRLVEDDARRRQGAFFTSRLWADEAVKEIDRVLGPKWREECIVWDPAAGTANLTRDYNDWGCLISSTAERPDVNVMKEQGWGSPQGHVFQYDFLNPGSDSPFMDTGDKNLIPDNVDDMLRAAAKAGKRLVFFMNPPYGTAGDAGATGTHKAEIASTGANREMKQEKMGACSQQLYAQFLYRCATLAKEYGFRDCTIGCFSVPTFMSSGSYRPFRDWWYKQHEFKRGMLFNAGHFADVSARWGISFTVWCTGGKTNKMATLPIMLKDVQGFSVVDAGMKHIYNSDKGEASTWAQVRSNISGEDVPKFTSGLQYKEGGLAHSGYCSLITDSNNLSGSQTGVCILPMGGAKGHSMITPFLPSNWRRAIALYSARKLVQETWDTQKDEYLRPNESHPTYEQWVNDCHIYALIHGSNNCTAMRDVQYKGKAWRIKNHWFWQTRSEALKALDTKDTPTLYRDCKEEKEDSYLSTLTTPPTGLGLSPDAQHVLTLLDALWLKSLPLRESYAAGKPELHLMAHDAGVYQLKHLWRDLFPTDWMDLQTAFKALSERLKPGVYEYGFLRH